MFIWRVVREIYFLYNTMLITFFIIINSFTNKILIGTRELDYIQIEEKHSFKKV